MQSKSYLYLFNFVIMLIQNVQAEGDLTLTIPMDRPLTTQNKQLYESFVQLKALSTLEFDFSPLPAKSTVDFIIFQAHTHLYNITLFRDPLDVENKTSGTNVGLYSEVQMLKKFYITNPNQIELKMFIAVQGYSMNTDPIPGGCNMEYRVPIAPFMDTHYNDDYILVDAAPAKYKDCNLALNISFEFYIVYLPENNLEPDVYFDAIMNMTTLENIKRIGRLIPNPRKIYWLNRRMLSAYAGTGAVYVAVAMVTGQTDSSSVYVPIHSYGCNPLLDGDCYVMKDILTKIICALIYFIGLFICYFGHRFFKLQTFLIGFLSGLIVTYILITLLIAMDRSALLFASAISGLCIGAIRTLYWWLYGIPVSSIVLIAADIGFLVSSLLYYVFPGSLAILTIDINFWLIFIIIISFITLILVLTNSIAILLGCAVIGGYATVFTIDVYLGSNLKYILINVIRRATVDKFNYAVLMPPFQLKDFILSILWLLLASTGYAYQYFENRGKPPFPPPPRSVRPVAPEELPVPISRPSFFRTFLNSFSTSSGVNERTPLLRA